MTGLLDLLSGPEPRALVFLVAVLLAPVLLSVAWVQRSPYTYLQSVFFLLIVLLVRILWRAQVPPWPLPPGQGALLVANHRSSIDPFFLQVVAPRTVHWMVAREYCEHPLLGWFLRLADVIPTNRSGMDTAATKAAIRLAAEGGLVGMFPEGRINMTDQPLQPGRAGAVLVALKARVPLLPCYIAGSPYGGTAISPLRMRAKVAVRFGEPIDLSPYYDRQDEEGLVGQLMLRTLSAIAALAGRPDFQPRLAGRRWRPSDEEVARDTALLHQGQK
jgi:1-acyl-sn-glycerol-3-phosphate acyltransferase